MPPDLHPAPAAPPAAPLEPAALDALRRLALDCAEQTDFAGLRDALRRGAQALEGSPTVEVCFGTEPHGGDAELWALAESAARAGRACSAPDAPASPPGMGRAVAVPIRVRGEPGAVAVAWPAADPGPERARRLAEALAEHAAVALGALARLTELKNAALRRDRFFSAMSHDLRTPITAIVGYSELLQDGIVGPLSERQKEMVERICQVSGELAQMVTDMLDLAKLDAGRMEFHLEPTTLGALVEAGLEAASPHLEIFACTVVQEMIGDPVTALRTDRARVRQVLANLIAHAAGAAPGERIVLRAEAGPDEVRLGVSDRGSDLVPGHEESLFEALPQGASRSGRAGPGAALSLALGRRIARAMGGEVEARPNAPGGATLTLHLPRKG